MPSHLRVEAQAGHHCAVDGFAAEASDLMQADCGSVNGFVLVQASFLSDRLIRKRRRRTLEVQSLESHCWHNPFYIITD